MGKLTKDHFKDQIGYSGHKRNINLYYFVLSEANTMSVDGFNVNESIPNMEFIKYSGFFPVVKKTK